MINIVSPSGMPTTRDARTADQCVSVLAPARLHLGFMDLHGGLGRSFGSLGLTVSTLATVVEAEPAATLAVEGPEAARAQRIAERLAAHHGTACRGRITVRQAIAAHVGLGSGTQLAPAVGTALAAINGWPATPRDIALARLYSHAFRRHVIGVAHDERTGRTCRTGGRCRGPLHEAHGWAGCSS